MPIQFGKRTATLTGAIVVEDVDPLAAWLRDTPRPTVNLRRCSHLHTAVLQALLAATVGISVPPTDAFLLTWVVPALTAATGAPPANEEPTP